jgi:hypothetical protein
LILHFLRETNVHWTIDILWVGPAAHAALVSGIVGRRSELKGPPFGQKKLPHYPFKKFS